MSERKHPESATIEAVYDLVKDRPHQQVSEGAALDNKMIQIFSAASVVLGLGGLSVGANLQTTAPAFTVLLVVFALIAYAAAALSAFLHLFPREYHYLKVDTVWEKSMLWNEDQVRRAAIEEASEAFSRNVKTLDLKAKTLYAATIGAGIETLLVVAAILCATVL